MVGVMVVVHSGSAWWECMVRVWEAWTGRQWEGQAAVLQQSTRHAGKGDLLGRGRCSGGGHEGQLGGVGFECLQQPPSGSNQDPEHGGRCAWHKQWARCVAQAVGARSAWHKQWELRVAQAVGALHNTSGERAVWHKRGLCLQVVLSVRCARERPMAGARARAHLGAKGGGGLGNIKPQKRL